MVASFSTQKVWFFLLIERVIIWIVTRQLIETLCDWLVLLKCIEKGVSLFCCKCLRHVKLVDTNADIIEINCNAEIQVLYHPPIIIPSHYLCRRSACVLMIFLLLILYAKTNSRPYLWTTKLYNHER